MHVTSGLGVRCSVFLAWHGIRSPEAGWECRQLQGSSHTVQRTHTSTTIIKKGLPLVALQFKGSVLATLLKELIKLLPRGRHKEPNGPFPGVRICTS